MWILIVLTISGGVGTKTVLAEYATNAQCLAALEAVDPDDHAGHFLTTCMPKPD